MISWGQEKHGKVRVLECDRDGVVDAGRDDASGVLHGGVADHKRGEAVRSDVIEAVDVGARAHSGVAGR